MIKILSVIAITSALLLSPFHSLASIQKLDYHPYGTERINEKTGTFSAKHTFTDKEKDSESGLQYFGARYYNPAIGRFTSVDPAVLAVGDSARLKEITKLEVEKYLSNPQHLNSYSYAVNNPLKYTDPQGEFIDTLADLAFIGYDVYKIGQAWYQGESVKGEFANLALDVGGALIPGVTGLGMANRAVKGAEKAGSKVAEGLKLGESFDKLGSVIENSAGKINSFYRSYAEKPYHGLDQSITRGVSPELLFDTVKNPLVTLKQAGGNILRLTERAGVVLDRAGNVVTSYTNKDFLPHVQKILDKTKK